MRNLTCFCSDIGGDGGEGGDLAGRQGFHELARREVGHGSLDELVDVFGGTREVDPRLSDVAQERLVLGEEDGDLLVYVDWDAALTEAFR